MKTFIRGLYLCLFISIYIHSSSCSQGKPDEHNHDHADHDHAHDDHSGHDHSEHGHDDEHVLEEGQVEMSEQQFNRMGLELGEATVQPFHKTIKSAGRLEAPLGQEAVITARSSGIISFLKTDLVVGASVNRGETLAYISDRNIADGNLLDRSRLQLELAKQEYERAQQLIQDSLITMADFNQARANFEQAQLSNQTLSAGTSDRGQALSGPIQGYITNILVSEGSYVQVGQAIATISRSQKLLLRVDLTENYIAQLPHIHSANFKTGGSESIHDLSTINGRVLSYARTVDPESLRLPIYFEFDNNSQLLAGTFVEVYLKTQAQESLTVPLDALIEELGQYSVYIRESAGLYRKQAVQLGDNDGIQVQILNGLEPGTSIVTRGAYHLKLASMSSAIPHGHAH